MAGKIGQVTGQEVKTYKGVDNIRVLQVALFGANPESVVYMNTSGEDTAPLNGDMVIVRELGADKYTFGVRDPVLLVSEPGEKRIYSRDSGGNVVASFYLKKDGEILIEVDGKYNVITKDDFIILVESGKKISLGNGTDELLSLVNDNLTEVIAGLKYVRDSSTYSNGGGPTGPPVNGALLSTPISNLEATQTALGNIKV